MVRIALVPVSGGAGHPYLAINFYCKVDLTVHRLIEINIGPRTIWLNDEHEGLAMRMKVFMLAALATASAVLASTAAPAQVLDLSGQFRCVQGCAGGLVGAPAYIAQNGWNMRLVSEAGVRARAWIDRPGHIWVQYVDVGAIYSADGMTIQFDNGTVWQLSLIHI